MRIEQSTRDGCVVVALHGALDPVQAPAVQHVLLKHLSKRPPAVVCDVSGVDAIDVICATVFTTAARPAARWPGTGLVLAGARPPVAEVLIRARVDQAVPVFATVDEALSASALPDGQRSAS